MPLSLLLLALLLPREVAPGVRQGETVAHVRIDGVPAEEAARFERYVELRPGDPLSRAAVRHAVELLYATGEFQNVIVETRRAEAGAGGAGGLEVVFRLVPAPLLAQVRLEGDRVLSPRALRRITRLRPGEPLWTDRLDRAARDAALHLAAQGYLEARVEPMARPARGGAAAVFTVRSGPRAHVSSVSLSGVAAGERRSLEGLMRPRVGQVFKRREAERAAERIRRRLVAEGRWKASVTVDPVYDPQTARVALTVRAEPGSLARVEYRGTGPPSSLREAVATLLRENALRGDVLEEAAERIEEHYRDRGHRDVSVSHEEETRPGDIHAVVFAVEPGPRAVVASLRLEGEGTTGRLVRTQPGQPLVDRALKGDARALVRALEDEGHAEARADPEVPEGGGPVPVVFRVRAGPRTIVRSVGIDAPVRPEEEEAAVELRLREGEPYRVQDLVRDRSALLASYRNAGHLQAEVSPEVTFSEDRSEVRIVLRVLSGPRTEVDHIVIAGLRATRESVVRRELLLDEGKPLGLQKVLESQRRLGALGIFQRVAISEMDPESVERRSLVVEAEEAPATTVSYGLGYAERDLLRASAEVTRRNLGGMDRTVSTFVRASFRGNRFLANYREPNLLGRRLELFVTGFREEEDREQFDFVRYGGLLQTARRLSPQWSLILRYAFQETRSFNVVDPDEVDRQFANSTISGPAASLVNDTRDDPLDPHAGHFLGADVQFSHERLGGDTFLKGFFQASAYRRLVGRVTVALNGRVGLARTFGVDEPDRLSRPDRFYAGGDYSLRGFKVDAVAPTGGNALLLGGAELRVDVGPYLSLAAFGDVGNVYTLISDIDLAEIRYTAGLGLRYKSVLGPLRIDWGYKLNRRPGESASRFHFTIGHAF